MQRRWVRSASASPARAIPLPDAALLAALQGQGAITLPSKVGALADLWDRSPIACTNYKVEDFDRRAVAEVERLLARRPESGANKPPMGVQIAVGSALKAMADHGTPSALHNLAEFGDVLYPFDRGELEQYLGFLAEYSGRDLDYLVEATDEQRTRAKAFVKFISDAERRVPGVIEFDDELDYYAPEDPKLTALIWTRPDRAVDVLEILVQQGGPLPVEVIEARLDHGTRALREGVL